MPPLTLLMGPAGAGKTTWILERYADRYEAGERPLLIVSSPQQAQTRAEQLAVRLGTSGSTLLPSLRTFRQLATQLAQVEERPVDNEADKGLRLIGRSFQRIALAELFRNTIRPDDFLGRMRHAPGFVPALLERLREWKLACLTPDRLEQSGPALAEALSDPTFPRKTGELARLFRAYQSFLQRNGLRDEEDCLQAAIGAIRAGRALSHETTGVLVDGFYRFNPMQRLLLAAFAEQRVEVVVTLPDADLDAPRPLLFAAPNRTLALLEEEFACQRFRLSGPTHADTPLKRLSLGLFSGHTGSFTPDSTVNPPIPPMPAPSVLLFDAPNPYVEAEMVAREFRRLYDSSKANGENSGAHDEAGGYRWSDFAVILRAMGDYAPILAAVFERYEIPLGVDGPEKLTENPMIKTLIHYLAVVRRNWQREDVLAFLKSSYTGADRLEADMLRRRARHTGVREGRERWLQLIEQLPVTSSPTATFRKAEPYGAEPSKAELYEESGSEEGGETEATVATVPVATMLRDMAHYETLLRQMRLDPREFASLIAEIVTFFGLESRIADGEATRQQRDRVAWETARDVLQALGHMASLSGRGTMSFDAFHDELLDAWRGASSITVAPGERVRVAEPYDARERPIRVAAVMGLTERVFPRRVTEDPFLRDEERAALRRWAGIDLEEQKGRSDDERFFFYLAITAPSERLILSYPRSSDESDTLPSFYLDEVRTVLAPTEVALVSETDSPIPMEEATAESRPDLIIVSRTLADVAPRPEEVISDADRLLAACAGLFDPGPNTRNEEAIGLMRHCLEQPDTRPIAQEVVASRSLPRLPRLEWEGVRRNFIASRSVYSVSELETYGRCPFQYLLRHVLRLRPEEEGIQARTQGTLLHSVLHRYYADGPSFSPGKPGESEPSADYEEMRARLQEILERMLMEERYDASPHQLRMMHRLLTEALDGFVAREQRFTPLFEMRPAHFELAFGHGQRANWDEDDKFAEKFSGESEEGYADRLQAKKPEIDRASCPDPLLLTVVDGGPPVAICGTLDRVDLDVSGRRALILDYKLGRPPDFAEIQKGRSLQMPLYMLAVERLFGKVGAVACYDSTRERGRRRFHRIEHVNPRQFMPMVPVEDGTTVTPLNRTQFNDLLKTAEATAVRLVRAIEEAHIEATPGDHCRTCAYSDVCRTTLLGGHDGE